MPMIYLRNDYANGCIPEVLELLKEKNSAIYPVYGTDQETQKAKDLIRSKMPDCDVEIYFLPTTTASNTMMTRVALQSYEGVIACESARLHTREAGAIEFAGHKILTVEDSNGKLTPEAIEEKYNESVSKYDQMVIPKLAAISNPTELGTIYTKDELQALHDKCKELDLYLMMDGTRLANALVAPIDYTMNDLPKWLDMFSIGGTRSGLLFGEAVIIANKELDKGISLMCKQQGFLLEKGWIYGIQYQALFKEDAYYKIAMQENALNADLQTDLQKYGYPLYTRGFANMVFPMLTKEQMDYLAEYLDFEVWKKRDDFYICRIVIGFHITKEDVSKVSQLFAKAIGYEEKEIQTITTEEILNEDKENLQR